MAMGDRIKHTGRKPPAKSKGAGKATGGQQMEAESKSHQSVADVTHAGDKVKDAVHD